MMTSCTAVSLLRFLSSVFKVRRPLSSPCQPGEPSPSAESSHSPREAPTITTRFLVKGWKAQVVLITPTEMSASTQLKRITHFTGHLFKPLDGCPMHASCQGEQSRQQAPCISQPESCAVHNLCSYEWWQPSGVGGPSQDISPSKLTSWSMDFFFILIYKSPDSSSHHGFQLMTEGS